MSAMLAAAPDLFGNPVTPPLLVRLDRQIDRDRPCCNNVAIVGPGKAQHAAELRCETCGTHRGWLPKQALDFVLENFRRFGAPTKIVWRDSTIAIGDETMTTEKKFDDTNHGALFKNTEKENPKHADYRGEINVNGEQFWINAWLRTSKKGTKFLSLSVKPKAASAKTRTEEMADKIPF
jgi:hypothetical protein